MATVVRLVTKVPSNTITKKQNEALKVTANLRYRGPSQDVIVGAVVTQKILTSEFDEIGTARAEVSAKLPDSIAVETPISITVPGVPLYGAEPKAGYGVKVYIRGTGDKLEFGAPNVLTVASPSGEIPGTPPGEISVPAAAIIDLLEVS